MSQDSLGILLLNLGTPDGAASVGPSAGQVKTYLREFLMDPFVIDIPFVFRWLLVNRLILPKRSEQSAQAYRKIWTKRGSPLLFHHLDLVEAVRKTFADEGAPVCMEGAMRYGSPSIGEGLSKLKAQGVTDILVVPLYPQYSLAATESSLQVCRRWAALHAPGMNLRFFPAFYDSARFIGAFSQVARENLEGFDYDHLLFSFHGLPERQVRRAGGASCLEKGSCCDEIGEKNTRCYRAQCFSTAKELARGLGLSPDRYTVCFQSRLGRTPWIKPYTDFVYRDLAKKGVKRVAVMCPAFVADCLETLEEIGIRAREEFVSLGGEDLRLVPSLNASAVWVSALTEMLRESLRSETGAKDRIGALA